MAFAALKGPWQIERMGDDFINQVSEAGITFQAAMKAYLESGAEDRFQERLGQVGEIEQRADDLSRDILNEIFAQTLIPDARADVMTLLVELDSIINKFEGVLHRLDGERPEIPADLTGQYSELVEHTVACVEALVLATRAYLRDPGSVTDEGHKVGYYESEADKTIGRLRKSIFAMDCELALKIQLGRIADEIAWASDQAEDIFDHLRIFALKRML
ncbi:MAG: DUF47 family protein [Alphaproteobacteria bacterium]|nr:DUF47 family protein [Alphaproteobacteria bacterium]